jgi:hypothetical protein
VNKEQIHPPSRLGKWPPALLSSPNKPHQLSKKFSKEGEIKEKRKKNDTNN